MRSASCLVKKTVFPSVRDAIVLREVLYLYVLTVMHHESSQYSACFLTFRVGVGAFSLKRVKKRSFTRPKPNLVGEGDWTVSGTSKPSPQDAYVKLPESSSSRGLTCRIGLSFPFTPLDWACLCQSYSSRDGTRSGYGCVPGG